MGASSSILTIENSPELTAELKIDYEKLKVEGKDDDEIQKILTEKYTPMIPKVAVIHKLVSVCVSSNVINILIRSSYLLRPRQAYLEQRS
jgi:hypothetical protein